MSQQRLKQIFQEVRKRIVVSMFLINESGTSREFYSIFLISVHFMQLMSLNGFYLHEPPYKNYLFGQTFFHYCNLVKITYLQPYLGVFTPMIILFIFQCITIALTIVFLALGSDTIRKVKIRQFLRGLLFYLFSLFEWTLTIPSLECLFNDTIPRTAIYGGEVILLDDSDSYALVVLFWITFCILNVMIWIQASLTISFQDPANNKFARARSKIFRLVIFYKLVYVILKRYTFSGDIQPWVINVVGTILLLGTSIRETMSFTFYDPKISIVFGFWVYFTTFFVIACLILHASENEDLTNTVWGVFLIVFAFSVRILRNRKYHFLRKVIWGSEFSNKNPDMLIALTRYLINHTTNNDPRIADVNDYNYYIQFHKAGCKDKHCPCAHTEDIFSYQATNAGGNQIRVVTNALTKKFNEDFIIRRFKAFFDSKHYNSSNCFALFTYYLSYMTFIIERKGKAYLEALRFHYLMEKNTSDHYILESIINHIKQELQKDLSASDMELFSLQIYDGIRFDELEEKFNNNIEELKSLYTRFFADLLDDVVDLDELSSKGRKYLKKQSEIQKTFEQLMKINPNSFEMIKKYLNYHHKVLDYPTAYVREWQVKAKELLVKKLSSSGKVIDKVDPKKELWHPNASVVFIDLSEQHPGRILKCNSMLPKFFGYQSRSDMLGQNINIVIPHLIARVHDDILRNYTRTAELHYGNYNYFRGFFGVNSDGYLFPLNLSFKFEPMDNVRPTAAGMFTPVEERPRIIQCATNGQITDFSLEFVKEFKLGNNPAELRGMNLALLIPGVVKYLFGPEKYDLRTRPTKGIIEKFYFLVPKNFESSYIQQRERMRANEILTRISAMHKKNHPEEERENPKYCFDGDDFLKIKLMFRESYDGARYEDYSLYYFEASRGMFEVARRDIRILAVTVKSSKEITAEDKKRTILDKLGNFKKPVLDYQMPNLSGIDTSREGSPEDEKEKPRDVNMPRKSIFKKNLDLIINAENVTNDSSFLSADQLKPLISKKVNEFTNSHPLGLLLNQGEELKKLTEAEANDEISVRRITVSEASLGENSKQMEKPYIPDDLDEDGYLTAPEECTTPTNLPVFNLGISHLGEEMGTRTLKGRTTRADFQPTGTLVNELQSPTLRLREHDHDQSPFHNLLSDRHLLYTGRTHAMDHLDSELGMQTRRVPIEHEFAFSQAVMSQANITERVNEEQKPEEKSEEKQEEPPRKLSINYDLPPSIPNLGKNFSSVSAAKSRHHKYKASSFNSEIMTVEMSIQHNPESDDEVQNSITSGTESDDASQHTIGIEDGEKIARMRNLADVANSTASSTRRPGITTNKYFRDILNSDRSNTTINSFTKIGFYSLFVMCGIVLLVNRVLDNYSTRYHDIASTLKSPFQMASSIALFDTAVEKYEMILSNSTQALTPLDLFGQIVQNEYVEYVGFTEYQAALYNLTAENGCWWLLKSPLSTEHPFMYTPENNSTDQFELINYLREYSHRMFRYETLLYNTKQYDSPDVLFLIKNDLNSSQLFIRLAENLRKESKSTHTLLTNTLYIFVVVSFCAFFAILINFYIILWKIFGRMESTLSLFTRITSKEICDEVRRFASKGDQFLELKVFKALQQRRARDRIFSHYKIERPPKSFFFILRLVMIYLIICIPLILIIYYFGTFSNNMNSIINDMTNQVAVMKDLTSLYARGYHIFNMWQRTPAERNAYYDEVFTPAYNQVKNSSASLRSFLLDFESQEAFFGETVKNFILQSRSSNFCGLIPEIIVDLYQLNIPNFLDVDFDRIAEVVNTERNIECSTILGGVARQGIIVAIDTLVDGIYAHVQQAKDYPSQDQLLIKNITASNNFQGYDSFILFTNRYMQSLIDNIVNNSIEVADTQRTLILIITIVTMAFLALIVATVWIKFIEIVKKRLKLVKRMLNLVPINILSSNVYIRNFIIQEGKNIAKE